MNTDGEPTSVFIGVHLWFVLVEMKRVDYDPIAPTYDERYRLGAPAGITGLVREMAAAAPRLLEVGCGTGHWLAEARPHASFVCGLDRSGAMLQQARASGAALLQGDAAALPFAGAAFDALLCINALHHFGAPTRFVAEAARVLVPGGRIAVVGMDPGAGRDRWYLYHFFTGTREADLARYPAASTIAGWLQDAGFRGVRTGIATRIADTRFGRAVFDDPILSKRGTSQLALLSEEEFAAGMRRIEEAIAKASAAGEQARFDVDLSLALVTAQR
jgi:ubiquinone/menaquinone biosynthesis C-methylase UbiE